ncbi:hypothetical protein ACHQM5_010514 [Ranunculus cassubicifolius]
MDVDSSMGSKSDNQNNINQIDVSSSAPLISSDELDQSASTASSSPQQQGPTTVVATGGGGGPRPAPTYTVVNAVIEKKEDGPGPRCGHTLTDVAAVGEEGTPGYIGARLILFGGATALEGNSAVPGPPSPAGSAGIRK